jgi:hypothetical protein
MNVVVPEMWLPLTGGALLFCWNALRYGRWKEYVESNSEDNRPMEILVPSLKASLINSFPKTETFRPFVSSICWPVCLFPTASVFTADALDHMLPSDSFSFLLFQSWQLCCQFLLTLTYFCACIIQFFNGYKLFLYKVSLKVFCDISLKAIEEISKHF